MAVSFHIFSTDKNLYLRLFFLYDLKSKTQGKELLPKPHKNPLQER